MGVIWLSIVLRRTPYSDNTHIYDMDVLLNPDRLLKSRAALRLISVIFPYIAVISSIDVKANPHTFE